MNWRKLLTVFPRWLARATMLCIWGAATCSAALPSAALRALDEGVPDVAIQKLRDHLLTAGLSLQERSDSRAKLCESELAASRPADALATLAEEPNNEPRFDLLRARALAASNRWKEALPLFAGLDRDGLDLRLAARFGEAEALRMIGRGSEAISLLDSLANEPSLRGRASLTAAEIEVEAGQGDKALATLENVSATSPVDMNWAEYLRGRVQVKARPGKAAAEMQALLSGSDNMPENLLVNTILGIADARCARGDIDGAQDILTAFIQEHPDSPHLALAFRKLSLLQETSDSPSAADYKGWAGKEPSRRASLARLYLAKLLLQNKDYDAVLKPVEEFIRSCPNDPLIARAMLIRGQALLASRRTAEALQMFEAAIKLAGDGAIMGESEFAAATARFQRREFKEAAFLFRAAGLHCDRLRERATFNSALSWGNLGAYDRFLEEYKGFSSRYPESELRRELVLEEGLLQARSGDPRAEKTLSVFIRDFPDHPRVGEARVALGEMALLANRIETASGYIRAAFSSPADEGALEQAEYLAICAADSAEKRDEAKVIAACESFIQRRASSPLVADARMKLGQIYFRKEDFSNARNQFELVARQEPDSRFAEGALYLAGQSALKSMNPDQAILLFDEVARMNGHLKLYSPAAAGQRVQWTWKGK